MDGEFGFCGEGEVEEFLEGDFEGDDVGVGELGKKLLVVVVILEGYSGVS